MCNGEELLLGPKAPISLSGERSEEEEAAAATAVAADVREGDSAATAAGAAEDGMVEEEEDDDGEPALKCLKCEKTMPDIYSYVSTSFISFLHFYVVFSRFDLIGSIIFVCLCAFNDRIMF